ncbi:toxin-antitoxin system YwqK family antitoxin [Sporocytophaga myxococcoides]|uniref:toxin-antitoxin system YwqK family antitoxin n=1 Tax=Sporocytophaga myxococcoides TaxID=153721 RepID=UPI000491E951|nr:hypothetical protein [Sporocytophaga myxococcoides]
MKRLYFLILLSIPLSVLAQRKIDLHIPNRVIVNFLDHVVYAEIVEGKPLIKVTDEYFYYWYSANDIKRTRGGFEGKLLHGLYSDFYMNKNLREKGMFRFGRKEGLWKSWHINGELKEVYHWKKGKLHGEFLVFDESGKLLQKGTYKDNLFNGKRYTYEASGNVKVEKYVKGELKVKKEKQRKGFKLRLWRKYKKKQTAVPQSSGDPLLQKSPLPGTEGPKGNDLKDSKKKKKESKKQKNETKPQKKKKEPKVRIRKMKKIVPAETEEKQT